MTKTTTYQELMLLIQDIEIQTARSPTYSLFNRNKISEFYKSNEINRGKMNRFIAELTDKYAKKDAAGRAAIVLVDGRQELDFNNEEDKQAFQEEYFEFLKGTIQLHI